MKLIDLSQRRLPGEIGEKARNLAWLIHQGYTVPRSYVLPFQAGELCKQELQECRQQIQRALNQQLDPACAYAVRSSANVEDSVQHSFAGQFNTLLNLRGLDNVSKAIEQLVLAGPSHQLSAYTVQTGGENADHRLALIVQEMVRPIVSGVAFSRNPITGLDEMIVEAVQGSGEKLVQEGQTPDRWVKKWGQWIAQPGRSEIDLALIENVSYQTGEIAKKYRRPVDLEWVYDGVTLYWVQLRPITGLEAKNIYSNRISREFFPGLIKPLIWSVNTRLVNRAWIKLFSELIGANDLQPEDLARSFGYRAYFNMGTVGRILNLLGMPRETLELMLGIEGGRERPRFRPSARTMRLLPRIGWFLLKRATSQGRTIADMARMQAAYARLFTRPLAEFSSDELLEQIDRLYQINLKAAEYNIVTPLVMGISTMLLRRQLAGVGVDLADFDLMAGMLEMQGYDPKAAIQDVAARVNQLDAVTRQQVTRSSYQVLNSLPGSASVKHGMVELLHKFGHLSDAGNDFSAVPWRENPEMVFQMVLKEAERLAGERTGQADQISRQPEAGPGNSKAQKFRWSELKLKRWKRFWLESSYQRARKAHFQREVVSSVYTYGYGLFRELFLELGRRLAQQEVIEIHEDIFYLTWDEVREVVQAGALGLPEISSGDVRQLIKQRQRELEQCRDLVYPDVIYGDVLPPVIEAKEMERVLRGVPGSSGYYRGPVKVIRSMQDFSRLEDGDVLVIPYSDVGWTPLFARAGAVIAESGGMLSHSSIVAREYNLPCVVSVPQACSLPDQAIVAVDGFKGEIYLVSTP
jgi:pyruvate,water dikinase